MVEERADGTGGEEVRSGGDGGWERMVVVRVKEEGEEGLEVDQRALRHGRGLLLRFGDPRGGTHQKRPTQAGERGAKHTEQPRKDVCGLKPAGQVTGKKGQQRAVKLEWGRRW